MTGGGLAATPPCRHRRRTSWRDAALAAPWSCKIATLCASDAQPPLFRSPGGAGPQPAACSMAIIDDVSAARRLDVVCSSTMEQVLAPGRALGGYDRRGTQVWRGRGFCRVLEISVRPALGRRRSRGRSSPVLSCRRPGGALKGEPVCRLAADLLLELERGWAACPSATAYSICRPIWCQRQQQTIAASRLAPAVPRRVEPGSPAGRVFRCRRG